MGGNREHSSGRIWTRPDEMLPDGPEQQVERAGETKMEDSGDWIIERYGDTGRMLHYLLHGFSPCLCEAVNGGQSVRFRLA